MKGLGVAFRFASKASEEVSDKRVKPFDRKGFGFSLEVPIFGNNLIVDREMISKRKSSFSCL